MSLTKNQEGFYCSENKKLLTKAVEALMSEHDALLNVVGEAALLVARSSDSHSGNNSNSKSLQRLGAALHRLPDSLLEEVILRSMQKRIDQGENFFSTPEETFYPNIQSIPDIT